MKKILTFLALLITSLGLIILGGFIQGTHTPVVARDLSSLTPSSWTVAQIIPSALVQEAGRRVYEEIPDFPLENYYILQATQEVATDNTLATRFIRYHLYTKGRTPRFRLDWKLTLADYLGVNDLLEFISYPSSDVLNINPMETDRERIQSLNRAQRDALIQVLVNVFNPEAAEIEKSVPVPAPGITSPQQPRQPSLPRQPQPGDANLLQ